MKFLHCLLALPLAVGLLLTSGCEKEFDTINANPNDPTSVPPERLLPHGIATAVTGYWGGSLGQDVGSGWAQHWARIQYTEIDQYNFTTDVQDGPWRTFYNESLANFQKIIELGKQGNNDNMQAVGLIMRAWTFSVLTDVYGDIPYREALQGTTGGILYPKYDSQKDVYTGLVADLKTANDLLNTTRTMDRETDILFSGNLTRWKKFANALSLRLLNRMIDKDPAARTELARILGDPAKYPLLASNADNVVLAFLARPNNNPINENRRTRDDHRVSKTLTDKLQSLSDPRLAVYADVVPGTSTYVGVPNGLDNTAAGNLGLSKTSKVGSYFVAETAPAVLLTFAEQNFIKAEAALKGVTAAGSAAPAYEAGIRASMEQHRLTVPAGYLAVNALKSGTAGLTQVLEQKWLALFGQGIEAWTEQRRTGVPVLKAPTINYNGGQIPTRLPYPSSEENLNGEHMKAALAGKENDMRLKLWWMP